MSGNLRTRFRFSLLFTIAVSLGERVSGKGTDLYEMCDELDALLTGNITGTLDPQGFTHILLALCIYLKVA